MVRWFKSLNLLTYYKLASTKKQDKKDPNLGLFDVFGDIVRKISNGRGDWTQTSDLTVPNRARYQLRHAPIKSLFIIA